MPEALRGFMTMGMLLSIPMVLAGLWLILRARREPLAVAAPDAA
jgi:phosphatidylglycerol:prolipoprotein diacylglycerol transferase